MNPLVTDPIARKVRTRYLEKVATNVEARFLVEAMSNLPSSDTGVDGAVIWISPGEFGGTDAQHGPRVKVLPGSKVTTEGLRDSVSVTISKTPRVIGKLPGKIERQVKKFILLNREVLLQHWKGALSSKETLLQLKKI